MQEIITISATERQTLEKESSTYIINHPVMPVAVDICRRGILASRFATDPTSYPVSDIDIDSLPLLVTATDFATAIYRALLTVKAGSTVSYGQLACLAGNPKAARAVGSAMRRNRHPLLIPCHRVLPADGSIGNYTTCGALGNYASSPRLKADLLAYEAQKE